jgi:hypothetical protein
MPSLAPTIRKQRQPGVVESVVKTPGPIERFGEFAERLYDDVRRVASRPSVLEHGRPTDRLDIAKNERRPAGTSPRRSIDRIPTLDRT